MLAPDTAPLLELDRELARLECRYHVASHEVSERCVRPDNIDDDTLTWWIAAHQAVWRRRFERNDTVATTEPVEQVELRCKGDPRICPRHERSVRVVGNVSVHAGGCRRCLAALLGGWNRQSDQSAPTFPSAPNDTMRVRCEQRTKSGRAGRSARLAVSAEPSCTASTGPRSLRRSRPRTFASAQPCRRRLPACCAPIT